MEQKAKERTRRWHIVCLIWSAAALAALLYLLFVRLVGFGVPCVLYELTGFSCPGCGLTRAAVALSRGELGEALTYNAMLLPYVGYVGWLTVRASVRYVRGEKDPLFFGPNFVHIAFLVATVIFGVVRNIV